jgi:hypothetical protein
MHRLRGPDMKRSLAGFATDIRVPAVHAIPSRDRGEILCSPVRSVHKFVGRLCSPVGLCRASHLKMQGLGLM